MSLRGIMRYIMCYSIPSVELASSHLEVGSGWGQESSRTRPADILVTNWTTASQQPSMSLLHLRSILLLIYGID